MSDLHKLTIADARDKLRAKEITSVELTQSCLDAIDAADALGAYVHKTPDLAIEAATAADARIAACLLYTSPSPRDLSTSRMPSSA